MGRQNHGAAEKPLPPVTPISLPNSSAQFSFQVLHGKRIDPLHRIL
jgi:hypothetical protein